MRTRLWLSAHMSTKSRHLIKVITDSGEDDLTITGHYMELTLEKLLFNQGVVDTLSHSIEEQYMLARFLYHNLWPHRISIHDNATDGKLIDTEGMQHGYSNVNAYSLIAAVTAINPENRQRYFRKPPSELEGHAKVRGWTWFEALPLARKVWPSRLLLRFSIHDPGEIGGWVRDTETFEFVFSPEIFSRSNDLIARLALLEQPRLRWWGSDG
jgi:hypothetical protein